MVNVVEGFRWASLGAKNTQGATLVVSLIAFVLLLILISGAYHFRRMEKNFADVV